MPDSKNAKWASSFGTDAESEAADKKTPLSANELAANDATNDSDGWSQYRHWISKAPAPRGRRAGLDPSLYSWKGYRDWSDQVKRNWIKEQDGDS